MYFVGRRPPAEALECRQMVDENSSTLRDEQKRELPVSIQVHGHVHVHPGEY